MDIENGISPSRRYRVIMMTEDAARVEEIITLPMSLPNNPETVEVWYQKYIPFGQLLIEVEPFETVEAGDSEETEEQSAKYRGYGDSLEYVGEDEPTDENFEEDDDGVTFVDPEVDNDFPNEKRE